MKAKTAVSIVYNCMKARMAISIVYACTKAKTAVSSVYDCMKAKTAVFITLVGRVSSFPGWKVAVVTLLFVKSLAAPQWIFFSKIFVSPK